MLFSDLLSNFDFKFLQSPISEMSLAEADILMTPNPDYPLYEGASPYRIDAQGIDAVVNFLQRGGRVLSAALPVGAQPLLTFEGDVFGFSVKVGKGKLAVIGDAGVVSNGLYHFPGSDNSAFPVSLFNDMSPASGTARPPVFEVFEFGHLSCATSEHGTAEKIFKTLRPQARFSIDHHYRHLTHESAAVPAPVAEALRKLPVGLDELAKGKALKAKFHFINISDGHSTSPFDMPLTVWAKTSEMGTDYIVVGASVNEGLSWKDIGADPAVFSSIGELARVNTVVQILAGTHPDGSLRYYTAKQGQIFYDRNARNPHYGFDILLGSRNLTISPTVP